jgi:hypothetical protein
MPLHRKAVIAIPRETSSLVSMVSTGKADSSGGELYIAR